MNKFWALYSPKIYGIVGGTSDTNILKHNPDGHILMPVSHYEFEYLDDDHPSLQKILHKIIIARHFFKNGDSTYGQSIHWGTDIGRRVITISGKATWEEAFRDTLASAISMGYTCPPKNEGLFMSLVNGFKYKNHWKPTDEQYELGKTFGLFTEHGVSLQLAQDVLT